jgi:hypothetical protein
MPGLTVGLALPTQSLFLHHRNSAPVHLHIQDGNRFAGDDRQIQLQSFLDLFLLALGDIASDGLGKRSTDLVVTSNPASNCICSRPRSKGASWPTTTCMRRTPGGKLRIFDVQFDIHWKLAHVTLGAQIVGPGNAHRTDDRQDGFAANFLVLSVMAASARQLTLIRPPGFRIAAVRLRRRRPLDGEPFARPTRPLPDRSGRPYAVVQRHAPAVGLLPVPPPHGSQQSFFPLLRPAPTFLRDRAQSTDLVVDSD